MEYDGMEIKNIGKKYSGVHDTYLFTDQTTGFEAEYTEDKGVYSTNGDNNYIDDVASRMSNFHIKKIDWLTDHRNFGVPFMGIYMHVCNMMGNSPYTGPVYRVRQDPRYLGDGDPF